MGRGVHGFVGKIDVVTTPGQLDVVVGLIQTPDHGPEETQLLDASRQQLEHAQKDE